MVICKYFQQGNCRFGQYCKFEHSFGNRTKTFNEEKNVALLVAEEVLQAERGGQWLLSCYGPFKEKKCIPGMEDVSPEEVRWEMYQGQKTGNMSQINAQFQQMYEQIKLKREALKNPTPQIFQMLEELQNSGTENKSNFPFGATQMNANQTSSVFGQKTTYGTQSNPFGSSSSTFNSTQPASSIFGRSANTNNTTSVFGGKPSFGGTSVFGGSSTPASSLFGGASKTAATPFGNVQNTQTFGGLASQSSSSVFGGSTANQSTFGQSTAFGATSTQQPTNSLFKPQTAHSSIFGGGSTTGVQNSSVFGGATTSSVFGAAPAVSNAATGTSIFGQSTTTNSAFGGTPVFGASSAFGSAPGGTGGSVFGGQSAFGATTNVSASNNVFGGANVGTTTFESIAQNTNANVFGTAAAPNTNVFGAAVSQNTNVFGATTTAAQNTNVFGATAGVAPNVSPFGVPASTAAGPFGTVSNTGANSVFATTASASGPFGGGMTSSFSQGTTFGFGATPATNTTSVFGTTTATSSAQSPFGSTNTFATAQQPNSVFGSSATTATASPFMVNTQQNKSSPFGIAPSTQSSPFGNFAKSNFGLSVIMVIDETAYSPEDGLTDDEKMIYRMNAFPEGRIPLKPPTKELS